jgi:hypothetical protein
VFVCCLLLCSRNRPDPSHLRRLGSNSFNIMATLAGISALPAGRYATLRMACSSVHACVLACPAKTDQVCRYTAACSPSWMGGWDLSRVCFEKKTQFNLKSETPKPEPKPNWTVPCSQCQPPLRRRAYQAIWSVIPLPTEADFAPKPDVKFCFQFLFSIFVFNFCFQFCFQILFFWFET